MGVMGLEEHGRPGPKVFEGPVDTRRVVATAEDLFGTRYAGIWYSDGGTEQKLVVGVVDAATSDQGRVSLNREDAERLLPLLKAAVPEDALSIEVTGFTVEPQTP